jgi:hypothetical protein
LALRCAGIGIAFFGKKCNRLGVPRVHETRGGLRAGGPSPSKNDLPI